MRRVLMLGILAGCGGTKAEPSSVASPATSITLATPCVADRQADAQQRIFAGADPEDVIDVSAIGDLDADGAPDEAVRVERRSEYQYAVYLSRGTCGHFVGVLGGFQPTVGTAQTAGMFDITTTDNAACEGAPCGCVTGQTLYHWDGSTYAADPQASTQSEEKPCDGAE